jgi:IS5 family transposase
VFRTINVEPTLWDAILPEQCRGLPPGLAEVDRLLDDPRFFEPFRPFFDPTMGRPSVPMETYIRMMVLKYRYRLGFEPLCREVADSIAWRRFCRIPLDCPVPHPSTLEKITVRVGERGIEELNGALLSKGAEHKVLKTDQVRADTTVVPANVAYPSEAGLLARGVARLSRLAGQLQAAGLARRTRFRDRTRSIRRRSHEIGAWLRRRSEEKADEVLAITGEMAVIAEAALSDALGVARNAGRSLRAAGEAASGQAVAAVAEIERLSTLLAQVIGQTRARLAGGMPDGASRIVSLHDPEARPIRKGRIGKPVEFGYKAQVVDNVEGIVVDYRVVMGNPPDAPMLVPAIRRIAERFGRVHQVAIPRKGRPSAARQKAQRSARFVKLVKWRTGSEGRISALKRQGGWGRSLMDGLKGTETWCGWGVLAHNSFKIAALIQADDNPPALPIPLRAPRPAGSGTPTGPPAGARSAA